MRVMWPPKAVYHCITCIMLITFK